MAHQNRKCICCGEKYSYCPSCSRADALQPSWKSEFCSESCMSLWATLTKYNMEFVTKDEAKEIISMLDLKPIDTYAACVQRDYKKVMVEEKKLRRAFKPVIDQVETATIEEVPVVAEQVHEVVKQENE